MGGAFNLHKLANRKGHEEPYESRDSRTDLWGRGGEIPLRYPTISVII